MVINLPRMQLGCITTLLATCLNLQHIYMHTHGYAYVHTWVSFLKAESIPPPCRYTKHKRCHTHTTLTHSGEGAKTGYDTKMVTSRIASLGRCLVKCIAEMVVRVISWN